MSCLAAQQEALALWVRLTEQTVELGSCSVAVVCKGFDQNHDDRTSLDMF